MQRVVAIIPARGGSKGIPNKNIIPFCGKPLLAWSIEQALAATGVDSVWVSSDSEAILAVAGQYGASTVQRPEDISGDTATSESAWLHALDQIESRTGPVDVVLAMQATSPLRESADIERALQVFHDQQCDSLFSCAQLDDHFIWEQGAEGLTGINHDYKNRRRRQDIVRSQYLENGSFYLFKPAILRQLNNRLGGKIGIAVMDFWKSFEIDDPDDLKLCAILMQNYLLNESNR